MITIMIMEATTITIMIIETTTRKMAHISLLIYGGVDHGADDNDYDVAGCIDDAILLVLLSLLLPLLLQSPNCHYFNSLFNSLVLH